MVRQSSRRRVGIMVLVLALAFTVVGVRLVDLQVLSRDRYTRIGINQRVFRVALPAERGSIFDRNGNDLAVSVPQQTVWADPRLIVNPDKAAKQLAPILGVSVTTLQASLAQQDKGFVYLARKVDDATVKAVRALKINGVAFLPESARKYPAGRLAAPVIGFTGLDNNGLGGLEAQNEAALRGKPGEMVVERDPRGNEIPSSKRDHRASARGQDLVLTIDQSMQYETERVLSEEVAATGAKGAVAIVMEVKTGKVLTMATVDGAVPAVAATDGKPAKPAQPAGPAPATERNRPLTDMYEPGSTNKAITIAGAIEDGLIGPDTILEVPDHLKVADATFSDHDPHPTEPWSTTDIIRESSNVGTIMIGQRLGKDRLDYYLRAFGFASTTGLEFPGEAAGLLLPTANYSGTSIATVPIGNGLAVTAMQMLGVYATIANGGVMNQPSLIGAHIDAKGVRIEAQRSPTRRVISTATADVMNQMLRTVVLGGTGKRAAIPGYTVAGKTGTARKPPYERPPYKYVASFAGFVPAENPTLAGIVVLDEPTSDISGGAVAAPVFARIMRYALRTERVPPTDPTATGGVVSSPATEAAAAARRRAAATPSPPTTSVPASTTPATPTEGAPSSGPAPGAVSGAAAQPGSTLNVPPTSG